MKSYLTPYKKSVRESVQYWTFSYYEGGLGLEPKQSQRIGKPKLYWEWTVLNIIERAVKKFPKKVKDLASKQNKWRSFMEDNEAYPCRKKWIIIFIKHFYNNFEIVVIKYLHTMQ